MTKQAIQWPQVRGKLMFDVALAPYTWFRVGGNADALFIPADEDDLADFLKALPDDVPVTPLGVGSNVIIRDGGVEGVVVRLAGKYWGDVSQDGELALYARAGALDLSVAKASAKQGFAGLSFLSGIPGTVGGAVRTNAGCYGSELKDILVRLDGVTFQGERVSFQGQLKDLGLSELHMTYRHSDLPDNVIVTGLLLEASGEADPETIDAEIKAFQARREESQPIRDKTGGSTFANPDPPGTPNQRSSWKLVDAAGMRGAKVGGAQVSEKHCNFLINTGDATAEDLEALGEKVRAKVKEASGVELRWEIRRIGRAK